MFNDLLSCKLCRPSAQFQICTIRFPAYPHRLVQSSVCIVFSHSQVQVSVPSQHSLILNCCESDKQEAVEFLHRYNINFTGYLSIPYCFSVTGSNHSFDPSLPGTSTARWLNHESGAAPCQCFTPTGIFTQSPGFISTASLPHS